MATFLTRCARDSTLIDRWLKALSELPEAQDTVQHVRTGFDTGNRLRALHLVLGFQPALAAWTEEWAKTQP